MTPPDLSDLLRRPEGEALDFKEADYALDNKQEKFKFLKDLLALANTPRPGSAFLVLGIRWTAEAGSSVTGLLRHRDESSFRAVVLPHELSAVPRFVYHAMQHDGKLVGVIEIPISGDVRVPYTPLKDLGDGLRGGTVYARDGTVNREAVGPRLQQIHEWFNGQASNAISDPTDTAWPTFLAAVDRFSAGRQYVLIADPMRGTDSDTLSAVGLVPWLAVLDFDPESETLGLLRSVQGTLERRRVLHRVVLGDKPTIQRTGTHWFFARGLVGRDSTIEMGEFRAWLKKYKRGLSAFLETVRAAIDPHPVTVVALWHDSGLRSWLNGVLQEVAGAFGELADFVIVSPSSASLNTMTEQFGASSHPLSLRALCSGLAATLGNTDLDSATSAGQVPMKDGAPWTLTPQDELWLLEELHLVHLSAGLSGDSTLDAFRRGAEIGWRDLQLGHDCQRDLTDAIKRRVERDLQNRVTARVNVYHHPGAGGTTVTRRVAWDLHTRFPVATLERCSARETAERVSKLASLTENSVLVLADGGKHSERDIDELYEHLRSQTVPCVILQVLRRFSRPKSAEVFWIPAELSPAEEDRFLDAYRRARPDRITDLEALASGKLKAPRTSFFFGLVAFDRHFQGLERYVAVRLEALTLTQREILCYLAIAYHYGQQSLPAQTFAELLGIPRSRRIDLAASLVPATTGSPVVGELVLELSDGDWRPVHSAIAEELVVQLVGGQLPRDLWRQNLSAWAIKFAEFVRGSDPVPGDSMKELAYRVFIYRDNVELLGTERSAQKEFSQLIGDVPEPSGRISVLRRLSELFSAEAHIHAHLGRFLGQEGHYKDAIQAIDLALEIEPDDAVVHHIRGMVFRYEAVDRIAAREPIEAVVASARFATESFERSRELRPDNEHGFISEVQLLIRVLDYADRAPGGAFGSGDPFIRDAIGRAEDLLDQVRALRVGERMSRYEEECRARLDVLYGDHSRALQTFDSLLSRSDVSKPGVRRQIVWTLLNRRGGKWSSVPKKDVERSSRLLEENLIEDSSDASSLRMWLRTIRQLESPPHLERIIERVAYWRARGGGLDAAFYLYVLHTLLAMEGSQQARADADRAQEECKAIAKYRRDRTLSFEWLGPGAGVTQLVHQSELGAWGDTFWEGKDRLRRVSGRVAFIDAPQRGTIELPGAVNAFFVPAIAGLMRGRDENRQVMCNVGFSYDGVRAWEVGPA